jgi:hypothetical protein
MQKSEAQVTHDNEAEELIIHVGSTLVNPSLVCRKNQGARSIQDCVFLEHGLLARILVCTCQ